MRILKDSRFIANKTRNSAHIRFRINEHVNYQQVETLLKRAMYGSFEENAKSILFKLTPNRAISLGSKNGDSILLNKRLEKYYFTNDTLYIQDRRALEEFFKLIGI